MNQRASIRIKNILISSPACVIYAGITCLILAVACISHTQQHSYISIWVVNAVLLTFIFRSPRNLAWPYFFAGLIANALANYLMGANTMLAIAFASSNSIEILLPMLLVPRDDKQLIITSMNKQTAMLVLVVPIACLISATLATTLTFDVLDPRSWKIIFNWFTIDLLAMMAIVPLGLSTTIERCKKLLRPVKLMELLIVTAVAMSITWLSMEYTQIRFIIILMPLLYAAYRLGLLGTAIIFFFTVTAYICNLIFNGLSGTEYSTMPELISISSLLMCITLIPALVIAILIDERDEFENKLQENEERFRGAIKYSAIGMGLVSPNEKWIIVNPALCDITGYTESELKSTDYTSLFHADDIANNNQLLEKVAKRSLPSYTIEMRCIRKDLEIAWIAQTVSGVFGVKNILAHFVVQIENITSRKKMEVELKHQASHDALTGLINRREIESKLKTLINDARTAINTNSLFFIDLDNFKTVNDTAGHAAGDELLRKISEIISSSVRATDTVARLGGDEFAVILPKCTLESAATLANNLIENIKNFRFIWDERSYEVGLSIGLVTFKPKEITLETILSQADIACYTAKSQGGNCVSIFKGSKSEASKYLAEIQLGPKIKKYIQHNLFHLYAQEIRPLQPEKKYHPYYEILLRMKDENGKLILPSQFLKSAERLNLTTEVDQWVVKQILIDQANKILSCKNFIISINISPSSITSLRFHKILDSYLSETNINKSLIGFDVKETAFINDMKTAQAFLNLLVKHGCFVGMENFGKGLSSLQYLKNFPKLHIKISGEFIRGIDKSSTDLAIVESINQLSHKLDARTVAEHVESDEIMEIVKNIGIDYAQGYAIRDALPLDRLIELLQPHRTLRD